MPTFRHLFIIDPIENLTLELDTSFRTMAALYREGQKVFISFPSGLIWQQGRLKAEAYARPVTFKDGRLQDYQLGEPVRMGLADFELIHMRKEPPFDARYLAITWMLDTVAEDVRIYNHPKALQTLNEKVSILKFAEFSSTGLLSASAEQLAEYLVDELAGDGIIKPLDLYGGRGVTRIQAKSFSDRAALVAALKEHTAEDTDFRLLQKFDEGIYKGEVRAFSIGGKSIAYCLKKPAGQNYLATTREGATLEPYTPSAKEREQVDKLSKWLVGYGVNFAGFDLISGNVSEINITSPRLLAAPGDDTDYFKQIADWVIADGEAFFGSR